jgi:pimeloyl-ACP methyl ester carboxylesterase
MTEHTIHSSDGRMLAVYEAGDPRGRPVLAIYGTPSSGLVYQRHADDARTRGIRFLTYDRPGYGGSDARPGRTVADCVDDVTALADSLGVERLAVWGVSGGGPHALACAALLPDRVSAAASLAAVAPWGAEGLDWLDGMGEENVREFGLALDGREALEPYLREEAAALANAGPDDLLTVWETLLTPVDAAVATADFAVYLLENANRAMAGGVAGWLDDDLAFTLPWGFDIETIRVPLLLWHGDQDRFVPLAHGRWLAERIPGVEARLTAGEGHLTLFEHRVPEVHAWLLERMG